MRANRPAILLLACVILYSPHLRGQKKDALHTKPGTLKSAVPHLVEAPEDLRALVQEAVNKAVQEEEQQSAFYFFHMRKETLAFKQERDLVEMKEGYVARTTRWQERALTPEEVASDVARLDKLLSNPEERARIFKRQQEESQRIMRLVKALPDGLLYAFDGMDKVNNRETYRLSFKPNPKFSPSSREALVYKSAAGRLWIDAEARTVVRMEGELMNDINIGWGILGHINKGGKVEMEQAEVSPGHWRITKLITEAKGRAFFFKSIEIWQHQYATNWEVLPKLMSLEEGIKYLKERK